MGEMIDVTDLALSDRVLDVVAKAKRRAKNPRLSVSVEHLTANERYAVAKLMGWKSVPDHWLHDAPKTPRTEPMNGPDFERLILEEQDEMYDGA